MTLLDYTTAQHFVHSQYDDNLLMGFALGVQHPAIHTMLVQDSSILPSPELQHQLIYLAELHWQHCTRQEPELNQVLVRYSSALIQGKNVRFDDLELHQRFPQLPLLKYYVAQLYADTMDVRDVIWQRHLLYCKTLCLALQNRLDYPTADICYFSHAVMVSDHESKQCTTYVKDTNPSGYQLNKWNYVLLPLPWVAQS